MSEEQPEMEGWAISTRRVIAAMVGILLVLALALTLSERRYRATIEPTTHPRLHRFPAPRLDGFDDPARPAPKPDRASVPAMSDATLRRAAASGDALLQDGPK